LGGVDVDPGAIAVENAGLAGISLIDKLGALALVCQSPLIHPAREVVAPCEVRLNPGDLATPNLGGGGWLDQNPPGGGCGLGQTLPDLKPKTPGTQYFNPVGARLIEIDGGAGAVDAQWVSGENVLRNLEHDRSIDEVENGAVAAHVSAESHRVEAD